MWIYREIKANKDFLKDSNTNRKLQAGDEEQIHLFITKHKL